MKLREGLSRGYLKTIVGILQSLLSAALEDGVMIGPGRVSRRGAS
jgi:hypothetical protein